MKRITFTVEFITPCFLGGADNKNVAEWRAASIRGQLRWWFRAVAGGHYRGDLDKVKEIESCLFGHTGRASAIRIRASQSPQAEQAGDRCNYGRGLRANEIASAWGDESPETIQRIKPPGDSQNPVQYLGYGAITYNREQRSTVFSHARFDPKQTARMTLQFPPAKNALNAEQIRLVAKALWCWLNLGGIGSKSRKGYGSLRAEIFEGADPDFNSTDYSLGCVDDFKSRLREIIGDLLQYQEAPEWSHFSKHSKIYASAGSAASWEEAMKLVGSWLIAFRRRYGVMGDRRGRADLSGRDYKWAKGNMEGIPDRAGFGLPLPFSRNRMVTWGNISDDNRRASPLHIHIAKFGQAHHVLLTYIPSRFIPKGQQLRWKERADGAEWRERNATAQSAGYANVVQNFLDDLRSKNLIQELV